MKESEMDTGAEVLGTQDGRVSLIEKGRIKWTKLKSWKTSGGSTNTKRNMAEKKCILAEDKAEDTFSRSEQPLVENGLIETN